MIFKVSVIIPTFNSEKYVSQALNSVLSQTIQDFEIILIDDASLDNTFRIVSENFRDERIRVYRNPQNSGVSYTRNLGLKVARGEWIALLDSDDWYAPRRLEKLLCVAAERDADIVADNLSLIYDNKAEAHATLFSLDEKEYLDNYRSIDLVSLIYSNANMPKQFGHTGLRRLGLTKPIFKKAFLDLHNIRYSELVKTSEDFLFLATCLAHNAKLIVIQSSLYFYRIHCNSLTHTQDKIDRLRALRIVVLELLSLDAVKKRLGLIFCLIQFFIIIELKAKYFYLRRFLSHALTSSKL